MRTAILALGGYRRVMGGRAKGGVAVVAVVCLALGACSDDEPEVVPPTSTTTSTTTTTLPPPPVGAASITADSIRADVAALATSPRHLETNAAGIDAAVAYLRTELAETGLPVREVPARGESGVDLPTVAATVEGSECPERVVVLGAHFDSVAGSPGADDNASGTAAVLALARALATTPLPATVVLAGFPFEEEGGPFAGAAALADALDVDGRTTAAMFSIDSIAYPTFLDEDGPAVLIAGDLTAAPLVDTIEAANIASPQEPVLPIRRLVADPAEATILARSDQAAFAERGVPAVLVHGGGSLGPHYHQPTDTVDTIDADFAARVTRVLLNGVIAFASADVCEGHS